MFDYRLKVFHEVATQMSFTKASQSLHISQPAVTRHIRELEEKLEERLFERKGNKIALTAEGELVLEYAKRMLKLAEELLFELNSKKGNYTGNLKIGGSSTISQYILPPILASFHKKFPKINISLKNGNSRQIEEALLNGEIDFGIVENDSKTSGIKYIDFKDDELITVCQSASSFAKVENLTLEELSTSPLVLREIGSGTLEVIEHHFEQKMINTEKLNIILHLGSTESIKNYLLESDAIGIVSRDAVVREIGYGLLRQIPVSGIQFSRKYRFVIPEGPLTGFTQLFIRYCEKFT